MKNLKQKKLYHRVYDELKNYIIKNNLRPGDRLPTEMEMCEKLGVSRNVLREAIKTFEIIGVLTSTPGVGTILNKFDANFLSSCMFLNLIDEEVNLVEQALDVRKNLEYAYSRQTFDSITDEQIDELENITKEMGKSLDIDYYEVDARFHTKLYSNIGNKVLTAIIQSTWECDRAYREKLVYDEPSERVFKHQLIVNALKKKEYQTYIEALDYHFKHKFKIKI
jgi:DNA-binding FadR family transcriptional regulator